MTKRCPVGRRHSETRLLDGSPGGSPYQAVGMRCPRSVEVGRAAAQPYRNSASQCRTGHCDLRSRLRDERLDFRDIRRWLRGACPGLRDDRAGRRHQRRRSWEIGGSGGDFGQGRGQGGLNFCYMSRGHGPRSWWNDSWRPGQGTGLTTPVQAATQDNAMEMGS